MREEPLTSGSSCQRLTTNYFISNSNTKMRPSDNNANHQTCSLCYDAHMSATWKQYNQQCLSSRLLGPQNYSESPYEYITSNYYQSSSSNHSDNQAMDLTLKNEKCTTGLTQAKSILDLNANITPSDINNANHQTCSLCHNAHIGAKWRQFNQQCLSSRLSGPQNYLESPYEYITSNYYRQNNNHTDIQAIDLTLKNVKCPTNSTQAKSALDPIIYSQPHPHPNLQQQPQPQPLPQEPQPQQQQPQQLIQPLARLVSQRDLRKIGYRCHVCGSGFEDRHRLQQHLSIHLILHPSWYEEKTIKETMDLYESKRGDYLCKSCNQRFETTSEFDRHMHLHREKPHFCELCTQDNKIVSFRYYRQLLTHLRSHCFLYSCRFMPDCKQTANRKDYLKLHILKHHLNNNLPEQYTVYCH